MTELTSLAENRACLDALGSARAASLRVAEAA